MSVELTRKQQEEFLAVAEKAAARASNDRQVSRESAGFALMQLEENWDSIKPNDASRRAWIKTVARNRARRLGEKADREMPMGRAGSRPPPMYDEQADERVALLISEMHSAMGSLGSLVAIKVDFERSWALIAEDAQSLLHAKYVEGLSTKEIAKNRGEAPGTVDNKLTAAKRVARFALEDLFDELRGLHDEDSDLI